MHHNYLKLTVSVLLVSGLTGCATGPSPTLSKYTEQQQQRCFNSLTYTEKNEAKRNVTSKMKIAVIPFAGLLIDPEEMLYKEYEKICMRKGVIKR